jgi:hypothetical protein
MPFGLAAKVCRHVGDDSRSRISQPRRSCPHSSATLQRNANGTRCSARTANISWNVNLSDAVQEKHDLVPKHVTSVDHSVSGYSPVRTVQSERAARVVEEIVLAIGQARRPSLSIWWSTFDLLRGRIAGEKYCAGRAAGWNSVSG